MTAQRRLVVEHIAARLRVVREHPLKHLAHGRPGGFRRRAADMALDIGREDDFGHQDPFGWATAVVYLTPGRNEGRAFRQGAHKFFGSWPAVVCGSGSPG